MPRPQMPLRWACLLRLADRGIPQTSTLLHGPPVICTLAAENQPPHPWPWHQQQHHHHQRQQQWEQSPIQDDGGGEECSTSRPGHMVQHQHGVHTGLPMQTGTRGGAWPGPMRASLRAMSTNVVLEHARSIRASLQLPPNPFTYKPKREHGPKQVLYRGRGMLIFRFLVRMKVFQLAGAFTAAGALSMLASDGDPRSIAAAAAVAAGCIVTSYCVWFYSGRYVGELSLLLPARDRLVFSVLDFWGSRQDDVVPLSALDAPFAGRSVGEVKALVRHTLMPVRVRGGHEYYISMGHGSASDEKTLLNILYGRPPDERAMYVAEGMSPSERAVMQTGGGGSEGGGAPVLTRGDRKD